MKSGNNISAQFTNFGMGTDISHKAFGKNAEQSLKAVEKEAIRIEGNLSKYLTGSEIDRINQSAGICCEPVSLETYMVLSEAVEFSKLCHGLFDVTIGPLVELWNSSKVTQRAPQGSEIREILPLVNYEDLNFDPDRRTVGLNKAGQSIDLGGIGKGFAGDRFLSIYQDFGITSAFSNIGGNVVTLGTKPDGSPWHVGILNPRQGESLIGSVSVTGKSVVTSGDYQRYFTDDQGKRHHHILNPVTGFPSESGLISVSIITERSITADALSTIIFVAGMDKGLEILKSFPGTEAILIDSDLQVFITSGLQGSFQTDKNINITIVNEMVRSEEKELEK
jgi:FAD:protein FMN transferase